MIMATNPATSATQDRADQLIAMGRRLIALISAEITAMSARRLDGASADWDEKERLSQAWRVEIARIKADPALLTGLDDGRRVALRDISRELESTLESHARAIGAMKEVTEGLVRAIAGEVAAARSAPSAYGRSGQVAAAPRSEASGLAVNAKA